MVELIVVENDESLHIYLRQMFNGIANLSLVGMHTCVATAIVAIEEYVPDMILLDLQSRSGKGVEVMRSVAKQFPGIQIKIATNVSDPLCRQIFSEMSTFSLIE